MLQFPADVATRLNQLAAQVERTGVAARVEIGGVAWEVRPTHWEDVNGIHGYLRLPGPGTVQTVRLGAREIVSKREQQRTQ